MNEMPPAHRRQKWTVSNIYSSVFLEVYHFKRFLEQNKHWKEIEADCLSELNCILKVCSVLLKH